MVALREVFAHFGIEFDDEALKKGDGAVKNITKSVTNFAQRMTAPALLGAVALFTRGQVEMAQELGDTSAALGLSSSQLRQWQFVAEASGVSVSAMNSGLETFSALARSAQRGDGDALYQFRRLGVQARDSNRELRPIGDLIGEVGQKIAEIGSPVRRSQLLLTHFGEAGRQLLPIFEGGRASIARLREEVTDLTNGDIDKLGKQSREVRAEQARWNLATQALTTNLALRFLPPLRMVLTTATDLVKWFKKLTENTMIFEAAVVVLGGVFTAQMYKMGLAAFEAFAPALLAAAPYIAAIAGLVLIVDDLMVFFRGGKSVIGDWIDSLYGVGTSKEVVDSLRLAFEKIGAWLKNTGTDIVSFFTTELPDAASEAAVTIQNAYRRAVQEILSLPGIGRALRFAGVEVPPQALTPEQRRRAGSDLLSAPARGFVNTAPIVAGGGALSSVVGFLGRTLGSLVGGPIDPSVATTRVRGFGAPGTINGRSTALQRRAAGDVRVTTNVGGVVVNAGSADPTAVSEQTIRELENRERSAIREARQSLITNVVDDER